MLAALVLPVGSPDAQGGLVDANGGPSEVHGADENASLYLLAFGVKKDVWRSRATSICGAARAGHFHGAAPGRPQVQRLGGGVQLAAQLGPVDFYMQLIGIHAARQINFGGPTECRVGPIDQREGAGGGHELHAIQFALQRARTGPAKARHGAAVGLIKRVNRQVFLVPLVADARVVAVARAVVPLGGAEVQGVECVVHQA